MFDWSLLAAPLVAGLLVVSTHVLLGRHVLERGIIFIDLTIAQVAALGVIVAVTLGLAPEDGVNLASQAAAAIAALSAAALLSWTERRFRAVQEALIGSLYVLSASAALLVLSRNPHGAEHMQELLTGQILWISAAHLWPIALLYALILTAWFSGLRKRPGVFYFLFALTVTASVQLVGVYLVFASLILPAIATHGLSEGRGLVAGYAIGGLAYAVGLWTSAQFDFPAGPVIVCLLAAFALVLALARGLVRGLKTPSRGRG